MISFSIDARYKKLRLQSPLRKAALAALRHQHVSAEADLSLVISGDAKLKSLNRVYRGEDHATDVLSFPSGVPDSEIGRRYLGDVVISLPRARTQARTAGHPLRAELQLLAVHGVLHLLGHDHGSAQERQRMWAAQDAILAELGLSFRSAEAEQLAS